MSGQPEPLLGLASTDWDSWSKLNSLENPDRISAALLRTGLTEYPGQNTWRMRAVPLVTFCGCRKCIPSGQKRLQGF